MSNAGATPSEAAEERCIEDACGQGVELLLPRDAAYRHPITSNDERQQALPQFLNRATTIGHAPLLAGNLRSAH